MRRCTVTWTFIVTAALIAALPAAARAQFPSLRSLAGYVGFGGYYFVNGSARHALGDPKWYANSTFYVKPTHRSNFLITGGLELVSASDHFLPFQGGNVFAMYGVSFRAITRRVVGRPRPYISGGLFAERIRSVAMNFDTTSIVPSGTVGVEYPFARYFTLTATYRATPRVANVGADGFSLSLRFFPR